jgi:hypothetical protein
MNEMKVHTTESISRQYQQQPSAMAMSLSTDGMSSEVVRSVAEIQTAMVVAKSMPRNDTMVWKKMSDACQRQSLAESALYAYPKGGKMVTGPGIRLAEELARCYTNLNYGFKEVERVGNSSRVEAFAWDLENNVKATREFWVAHTRDTRGGGKALDSERDIYEHIASMAQRRVRAVLLECFPADLVEESVLKCEKTMREGDGKPMKDRLRDAVIAYENNLGVSVEMLEDFLGHPIDATIPAEMPKLQSTYQSINNGMLKREDVFESYGVGFGTHKQEKEEEPKPEPEKKPEEKPVETVEMPKEEPKPEPEKEKKSSTKSKKSKKEPNAEMRVSKMSDEEKKQIEKEEADAYVEEQKKHGRLL